MFRKLERERQDELLAYEIIRIEEEREAQKWHL